MARLFMFGAAWVCALAGITQSRGETLFVAGGDGIYAFEFAADSGRLSPARLALKLDAPSFLAAHPSGWFLLAALNAAGAATQSTGQLVSCFIEPNAGILHEVGRVDTGGPGVAHVEIDARRGAVFVANSGSGTVAGFPLGRDGRLGSRAVWIEHEGSSVKLPRQAAPHPGEVRVSPDGRHLYVPDLGTDEVFIYEFGEGGVLHPAASPTAKAGEGDGPRCLDFHPTLPIVYLITELSSRITVFQRDVQSGNLTAQQSVATLPPGFRGGGSCTAIRVHRSGQTLYVANRGHDSIAAYRLDGKGYLQLLGYQGSGGKIPLHFAIHPSGKWLVVGNQGSSNLAVFSIDSNTGALQPAGDPVPVWAPACLAFAPAP